MELHEAEIGGVLGLENGYRIDTFSLAVPHVYQFSDIICRPQTVLEALLFDIG